MSKISSSTTRVRIAPDLNVKIHVTRCEIAGLVSFGAAAYSDDKSIEALRSFGGTDLGEVLVTLVHAVRVDRNFARAEAGFGPWGE